MKRRAVCNAMELYYLCNSHKVMKEVLCVNNISHIYHHWNHEQAFSFRKNLVQSSPTDNFWKTIKQKVRLKGEKDKSNTLLSAHVKYEKKKNSFAS